MRYVSRRRMSKNSDRLGIIASVFFVAIAFFALNIAIALPEWSAEGSPRSIFIPRIETVGALWATFLVYSRRLRARWRAAVGVVVGYVIGFAVAEAAIRYIYARPFVPRADIPMARSLLQLTVGRIGPWAGILTPVVITAVFVAFFLIGIAYVSAAGNVLSRVPYAAHVLAAATVLSGGAIAVAGVSPDLAIRAVAAWGESGRADIRDALADDPTERHGDPLIPSGAAVETHYRFPGILDRDIYVFAVEAYGYAAFSREELAASLRPERTALEATLGEKGYRVVSSFLRSPVAGGFSWLAEATLLTGQWIDSQPAFEELYGAELPTLSGFLHAGGYYTLTVRPGTVHGSWPEGWELYRFEDMLVAYDGDFGYAGPWFSYVAVTDQFALWAAHRRIAEVTSPGGAAYDRPLFAYYQLVSSHTPFNRIPPLIDDWERLGDGSIYRELADEVRTFDNTWTGGTQLDEGYIAAISYVFRVISDYVEEHLDVSRSPVIMIFGDHQAQRPIRELDAHLSVPIHIAARDGEILDRFVERGFEFGMEGSQAPPHTPMSEFFPLFVDVAAGDRDTEGPD